MRLAKGALVAAMCIAFGPAMAGCGAPPPAGPPPTVASPITASEHVSSPMAIVFRWSEWPLKVDSGWVECWNDYSITFRTEDGDRYALNGHARQQSRWQDVTAISVPGYGAGGTSIALVSLVQYANSNVCHYNL